MNLGPCEDLFVEFVVIVFSLFMFTERTVWGEFDSEEGEQLQKYFKPLE